jgi:uncharacterized membrane protein YgcG
MSVVSEIRGRAGVRRPVAVEVGAIAVMWVLLFAAAYSLASGSGAQAGPATPVLATGSPVGASSAIGGSAPAKPVSIVALPNVPGAPNLKLAPKPKPHVIAVVSRPVVVAPVVRVAPTPVVERPPVVVTPPVVTHPVAPTGSHPTSTGSTHSSGSSSQTGTGTVSGGG